MPNWCSNEVTIEGDADQLKEFGCVAGLLKEDGTEKDDPEFNFSDIYPCDQTNVIQAEAEFQESNPGPNQISNELFNWNRSHWGTKWDVGEEVFVEEVSKKRIRVSFDTAWSPPEGVLQHIVGRWPKLTVHVRYEEPGNDLFGQETYYGDEAA